MALSVELDCGADPQIEPNTLLTPQVAQHPAFHFLYFPGHARGAGPAAEVCATSIAGTSHPPPH